VDGLSSHARQSTAERFRHEATRIRREAERVRDESIRQSLLDIVRQYEELAEAAEKDTRRLG
jgi:hypothetical protein